MQQPILDPHVLSRIRHLELLAREAADRALSGVHRSRYHGSSIEFSEHREYNPGDEMRTIDWKVVGKTDKVYIKQFEHETSINAWILLDTSGSMGYRGGGPMTKLEFGARLAASILFLLHQQHDSIGMGLIVGGFRDYIPPRATTPHWHSLLGALASADAAGETDLVRSLEEMTERQKRRGMVIVISDFYDESDNILRAMRLLKGRRNEVLALQVIDPHERTFPFENLAEFVGMEGAEPPKVLVEPREIREAYIEEYEAFLERMREGASEARIDWALAETGMAIEQLLARFIAARGERR